LTSEEKKGVIPFCKADGRRLHGDTNVGGFHCGPKSWQKERLSYKEGGKTALHSSLAKMGQGGRRKRELFCSKMPGDAEACATIRCGEKSLEDGKKVRKLKGGGPKDSNPKFHIQRGKLINKPERRAGLEEQKVRKKQRREGAPFKRIDSGRLIFRKKRG